MNWNYFFFYRCLLFRRRKSRLLVLYREMFRLHRRERIGHSEDDRILHFAEGRSGETDLVGLSRPGGGRRMASGPQLGEISGFRFQKSHFLKTLSFLSYFETFESIRS